MPHLLVERIRSVPLFCARRWSRSNAACAYFVEFLDIFAGFVFLVGSGCFLPAFSHQLDMFLIGCGLFAIGSAMYLGISLFTLTEAIREKGTYTFESCENGLYVAGSLAFLVGTVLYWPESKYYRYVSMGWAKAFSIGAYLNWFSPEFEGSLLFVLGSLLFAAAAFINGLSQRCFLTAEARLLTATTSLYMAGSLFFVMGSVAFLPELGCNDQMIAIGAWCFVIGSTFFEVGGVVSLLRTSRTLRNPENNPLVDADGCAGKI